MPRSEASRSFLSLFEWRLLTLLLSRPRIQRRQGLGSSKTCSRQYGWLDVFRAWMLRSRSKNFSPRVSSRVYMDRTICLYFVNRMASSLMVSFYRGRQAAFVFFSVFPFRLCPFDRGITPAFFKATAYCPSCCGN